MSSISELASAIGRVRLNPSLVQDAVYESIDNALNGEYDIVDPSTPYSTLLGAGTALFTAGMAELDTSIRQQYPELAQTYEDLYYHMSNWDYIERFCEPAKTTMIIAMSKQEIMQRVVPIPGSTIKQMVIPRNTQWTINNYVFTMQYPVVIRLMPYGGLEFTYDNRKPSPILSLESNLVDWNIMPSDGIDLVIMRVPVAQFKITSKKVPVTGTSTFKQEFELTDQYYYCRVWGEVANGTWTEYRTTHNSQVFDANYPTALLKVMDKKLELRIPQIYMTNGNIAKQIRIDVYTSQGAINVDLSGYAPSNFVVEFNDLEATPEDTVYSAPLGSFNQMAFFCGEKVIGGSNGLTFEQLRERVIHNANNTETPITDAQLTTSLQRRGFDILKSIEDINLRTYLATRNLPPPASGKFPTGVGCSIETMQITINQLVGYSTVADNGKRVTIKPGTLYQVTAGKLRMVTDQEVGQMQRMSGDMLANLVNNNTYMFSPFHYVLDTNSDEIAVRPYYLENPTVNNRVFIEENETTLLDVSPDTFTLTKTETGYTLIVSTKSGESWKALRDDQCWLQLAMQPEGDTAYAFMNGKLLPNKVNGERVYQFDITTNWDLNAKDSLMVDSFTMFNQATRELPMVLSGNWDLVYVVSSYDVYKLEKRSLDIWKGNHLLPTNSYGVSRHRINTTVGDALSGLWSNSRPVAGSQVYATWPEDVLAFWKEDVYEKDANGYKFEIVDGKIEYKLLHKKGDPIIDPETGLQKIEFRKGTTKNDPSGKPMVLEERKVEYQYDIFMLDGVYYFATDPEDIEYITTVPQTISNWLTTDIKYISGRLLENTKLKFYPKRTLGYTRVIINDGREVSIPASLKFHVTYHMSLVSYANQELKTALAVNGTNIISSVLTRNTVAVSDMISRLAAAAGDDAIGVKVDDFGPNKDISTYTAVDESMRCAIKRKLSVLPEGVLRVEQDVTFDYVNHQLQTLDKAY